jgi:hypothetical protein
MKIIRNTIKAIMKWAVSDKQNDYERESPMPVSYNGTLKSSGSVRASSSLDEFNNGFNFTVFNATGGKVIRVHSYDPKQDRHISNLYIITDKEDFGEELAQIITRDSLSR